MAGYWEDANEKACPICGKFPAKGSSIVATVEENMHRCAPGTLRAIDNVRHRDPDEYEARTPSEGQRLYDGFKSLGACEE